MNYVSTIPNKLHSFGWFGPEDREEDKMYFVKHFLMIKNYVWF